jgi:hypothetical protein
MLIQQAGYSSTKNVEKERAGNYFRSFWDNINQLMVDYPIAHTVSKLHLILLLDNV